MSSTLEKPLYKIVQCTLCDKEMTITHLARHMKEIHNTKRVKCYICPKSFKRKEKAINHLRNIHDIKMQDIKRNLLKEVDVPLPKNNNIKPREYKRKMVKLRDGENFDGVLNSNQIHSEYIKDKILHDDTHDRRKYLNMTEEEINLLRKENRSSQKVYSRSKSSESASASASPVAKKRSSARTRGVKREYGENDDEEYDEDDDDEEEEDDEDDDESSARGPSRTASTEDSTITGIPAPIPLTVRARKTSQTKEIASRVPDDEGNDDGDYAMNSNGSDVDVDSEAETSMKISRDNDSPQLPYDVYEKVRLVSFQISNEIGASRATLSFQFLTNKGKPLVVYLLREHEIKLFFMNSMPDLSFFERLEQIIEDVELLDTICVTNGEIITTENFGFRYKTFCWTTMNDFMK